MAVLGSDNISHSGDFKINVNSADRVTITTTGKIQASAGTNWVGTVSENGTSAIIERDSNANGEYVKYADGTMIANLVILTLDFPSSAIYASVGSFNYPVSFSTAPRIQVSLLRDFGSDATTTTRIVGYPGNVTSTGFNLRAWNANPANFAHTRSFYALAFGVWY